ncbi:hypothetical protein ACS0TY_015087 [Phlomoides rotata]
MVHTVDDGKLRRFIVDLSYLADPRFLMLLEKAEQEFGFEQMGICHEPTARVWELKSMSWVWAIYFYNINLLLRTWPISIYLLSLGLYV